MPWACVSCSLPKRVPTFQFCLSISKVREAVIVAILLYPDLVAHMPTRHLYCTLELTLCNQCHRLSFQGSRYGVECKGLLTSDMYESKREEGGLGREWYQGHANLMICCQSNRELQNKNCPSEKSQNGQTGLGAPITVLLRLCPECSLRIAWPYQKPWQTLKKLRAKSCHLMRPLHH